MTTITLTPATAFDRYLEQRVAELRDQAYRLADLILATDDQQLGHELLETLGEVVGDIRLTVAILEAGR